MSNERTNTTFSPLKRVASQVSDPAIESDRPVISPESPERPLHLVSPKLGMSNNRSQTEEQEDQHLYFKGGDLTSHEADTLDALNKFPIETLEYKFSVPLTLPISLIHDLFRQVATNRGYMVIEEDSQQLTAIRENFLDWKGYLTKCIPFWKAVNNKMMALRLNILTNTTKCNKIIHVKALCGNKNDFTDFAKQFRETVESNEKLKALTNQNSDANQNSFFADGPQVDTNSFRGGNVSKYIKMKESMTIREEEEEGTQMKSNLETYSIYHFNKILSNDAYTLGKKVANFTKSFIDQYQDIDLAAKQLPRPLETVIETCKDTTETLFCEFNYGRSETRKIMPFCKFAVEKYIFEKLHTPLSGMYQRRTHDLIQAFKKKRKQFGEHSIETILNSLDIKRKLWLIPEVNAETTLKKRLDQLTDGETPYSQAINELDKLEKLWNPREKLNCLLMMQSLMRSSVVEFYHGKEELSSMDDELPIVIFIVLRTQNNNFPADLQFIEHYINFEHDNDYEARLLTNLRVSLQFICKEWSVSEFPPPSNGEENGLSNGNSSPEHKANGENHKGDK